MISSTLSTAMQWNNGWNFILFHFWSEHTNHSMHSSIIINHNIFFFFSEKMNVISRIVQVLIACSIEDEEQWNEMEKKNEQNPNWTFQNHSIITFSSLRFWNEDKKKYSDLLVWHFSRRHEIGIDKYQILIVSCAVFA